MGIIMRRYRRLFWLLYAFICAACGVIGWLVGVLEVQERRIDEYRRELRYQKDTADILQGVYRVPEERSYEIVSMAFAESRRHDIDPIVPLAVMAAESNFDPDAFSNKAAVGLMQVRQFWAVEFGLPSWRMLYEPETNIRIGMAILANYRSVAGRHALVAFNRGITAVMDDVRVGADPENGYTQIVAAHARIIRGKF